MNHARHAIMFTLQRLAGGKTITLAIFTGYGIYSFAIFSRQAILREIAIGKMKKFIHLALPSNKTRQKSSCLRVFVSARLSKSSDKLNV